jgi:outer membrane receptor for ferrienterochelin and colicin
MEHNKEENTVQGTEHSVPVEKYEWTTLDGEQTFVQCSQRSAKLRSEALLLAFHYYMNLNLKLRYENFYETLRNR